MSEERIVWIYDPHDDSDHPYPHEFRPRNARVLENVMYDAARRPIAEAREWCQEFLGDEGKDWVAHKILSRINILDADKAMAFRMRWC